MSNRTVGARVKVYAVGVLVLVMGIGAAGVARGGAAVPDTSPVHAATAEAAKVPAAPARISAVQTGESAVPELYGRAGR